MFFSATAKKHFLTIFWKRSVFWSVTILLKLSFSRKCEEKGKRDKKKKFETESKNTRIFFFFRLTSPGPLFHKTPPKMKEQHTLD